MMKRKDSDKGGQTIFYDKAAQELREIMVEEIKQERSVAPKQPYLISTKNISVMESVDGVN